VRRLLATLCAIALVSVAGSASTLGASGEPEITSFTIEPNVAWSNVPVRIRFEFRGAEGGLRSAVLVAQPAGGSWRTSVFEDAVNRAIAAYGPASEGAIEAASHHQSGYSAQQRGTTNVYELRVTDRAGRKSNALRVTLDVRPPY
jgi:hypothetical protein